MMQNVKSKTENFSKKIEKKGKKGENAAPFRSFFPLPRSGGRKTPQAGVSAGSIHSIHGVPIRSRRSAKKSGTGLKNGAMQCILWRFDKKSHNYGEKS